MSKPKFTSHYNFFFGKDNGDSEERETHKRKTNSLGINKEDFHKFIEDWKKKNLK